MTVTSMRSTRSSRQSYISHEITGRNSGGDSYDERNSYTNSDSMIPKPPRIVVLGPIKRVYSSTVSKIYFITKFQMPYPSDYSQFLYIPE